ncbi:site-2 protease family protein [uncultured Ruthenibacterium sp.]|uniref:site-2 protease family protein n=1 Tax=uncultured Ruthenibacterium sp. TaxID=1905347 RepID=UPI00349EF6BF
MDYAKLALYVARAIALLTAIPFHEAAHAWASDKLGDPTAKMYGRMSLNPVRHFDLLGALCMILVGFGWAKPVPVAARNNFRHPRRDMALSAAAGPLANVLLAVICLIFYKLVWYLVIPLYYGEFVWLFILNVLSSMISVNITLAVFNLLPVPPLDGSRIFNVLLPERIYFGIMRYERVILFCLFAVLWLGVLDGPLNVMYNWLLQGLDMLTGFIDWIFT